MTSSSSMAGPSHVCLALGLVVLMWSAGQARSVNLGQEAVPKEICDACLEFSSEVQMILSDPDTQRQAIELISQMTCQSLTPGLKSKCLDLVNVYVADAFVALQAYLGPEVCMETGLCKIQSTGYINARERLLDGPRWADDKTCALCQDFATDALSYLESSATKSKVIDALHLACSRLEQFGEQCDVLVDVYAPDLMEYFNDITPEAICEMPHLCTPSRKPALASRVGRATDCAVCQFVVLELKLKLKDPATQEKLLEALFNGCNRVQNHVDECKKIVTQYAPFILANLDTILDADALCSKIGACKIAKLDAVEPVLASVVDRQTRPNVHVL